MAPLDPLPRAASPGRRKGFRKEADVRRWWREQAAAAGEKDALFWVEVAAGGTFGLHDLLYAVEGRLWPIELKLGAIVEGELRVSPRENQVRVWRRMEKLGVPSLVCAGLEGTRKIAICLSSDVYSGKTMRYAEFLSLQEIKRDIFSGSKFVFFIGLKTLWKKEKREKGGEFWKAAKKANLGPRS